MTPCRPQTHTALHAGESECTCEMQDADRVLLTNSTKNEAPRPVTIHRRKPRHEDQEEEKTCKSNRSRPETQGLER